MMNIGYFVIFHILQTYELLFVIYLTHLFGFYPPIKFFKDFI